MGLGHGIERRANSFTVHNKRRDALGSCLVTCSNRKTAYTFAEHALTPRVRSLRRHLKSVKGKSRCHRASNQDPGTKALGLLPYAGGHIGLRAHRHGGQLKGARERPQANARFRLHQRYAIVISRHPQAENSHPQGAAQVSVAR